HDVSTFIDVPGPVDGILHFASPASPIDYLEYPIPTLKVCALGTHNALGLAKAKGARFLLASTSEVYGDPLVDPQPESYWGNVNPREFTGRQLADRVLALTGSRSPIVERPLPVDDPKVRQPDITRAKRLLGWEPQVPLEEGLRRTIAYFRDLVGR